MHILDDAEEQLLEAFRKQRKGLESAETLIVTWEKNAVTRRFVSQAVAKIAFQSRFGGAAILPKMAFDEYTTGTGQVVKVHAENDDCKNGCVIHNPTNHSMRDFPTHWRDDRGIMERLCPHGVGHPDPDGMEFIRKTRGEKAMYYESVHGCDGCCAPKP